MTIAKARKAIRAASQRVNATIAAETNQNSLYSRGLAREGYNGGYAAALQDVLLVLNGVKPNRDMNDWWSDPQPDAEHTSAFNSGDLMNAMCGGNRIPQRGAI